VNVAITNVKHVWVELNNLVRNVSIESWWWLWNRHSCIKSELR